MQYERTEKDNHIDTIWYEIDMLRFAIKGLSSHGKSFHRPQKNLFIEGALLHFRNLIRFFSGKCHRKDDLSTSDPKVWSDHKLGKAELAKLQTIGTNLDDAHFKDISGFLQHMTKRRADEAINWDLDKMYDQLQPAIEEFEKAFPRHARPTSIDRGPGNTTATML